MKYIILLLTLCATSANAVTLEVTPEQQQTIVKALKVYRDLHNGDFKIVKTAQTNNTVYREIRVAGQAFLFADTIKMEAPKLRRHYMSIMYGDGVAAHYAFSITEWLSISAEVSSIDGGCLRGGIGIRL